MAVTYAMWALFAFYSLIALRWALGIREITRSPVEQMRLAALPQRAVRPDDPTLTVLIAAHNEGDNIAACLDRLRQQNYTLHQIIVIDDRSRDTTAEIVAKMAAVDSRILLVSVKHLPDGWIGKTHALARGAAHATGDYLLFVDSDVTLKPGAVAAIMEKVAQEKVDFLTLWPRLGLRSLADRILVPAAGWLLSFWAWTDAATVAAAAGGNGGGRPATPTDPIMGNGQFLLVRREAYHRIGGHDAVRAELAEDAMLAMNAHKAGLARWVGLGVGLYVASRNSTFSRCSNGLARVIIGSLVVPWKVLLSTQIVLGGCVTPFWIAPLAAALWAGGADPLLCAAWIAAAAAHVAAMFATLRRLFDFTMEERGTLWWFPLGCLCVVYVLIWSFFIMTGRGTIRWGATRYTVQGSRILAPLPETV